MKPKIVATLLTGAAASQLSADNLIWSDNFNVPDSGSFDAASLTDRRGGFYATEAVLRSANVQHQLLNQQLRLGGDAGRVRFEIPPGGAAPINSYSWSGGSAAARILSGGGMRVEFDYLPTNNSSDRWLSFSIGFPRSSSYGEPTGFRLTDGQTDFGFLLRNNGATQYFKNAANALGGNFTATATSRHVVIRYGFTSVDNGSAFTAVVSVDGTEVINQSGTWANNSGHLMIELGALEGGTLVDNFKVYELTPTRLQFSLSNPIFESSLFQGDDIGTLSSMLAGLPGGANYTLVSGTGDIDNAKFQITGDKLELGSFNFKGSNSVEGQQYSVRVRGTSTGGGGEFEEKVLTLILIKDDDSDDILDAWEISKAGNITTLSGDGVKDTDNDGLTDLEEYKISLGTSTTYPTKYANINPTLADTDGDGLKDREELVPTEFAGNQRPATNPTIADTDGDGLSDGVESNTGIYVSEADSGTDPTTRDWDQDGLTDGFEVTNQAAGYNPITNSSSLDTDGDGLTTSDEVFYGSSVLLSDTDGDTLSDKEEVQPTHPSRPATNPARADSDFDGLSDLVETNSTVYVGPESTGTDPNRNDTDGDAARDGVEVAAGSSPLVPSDRPSPPAGVALVKVTDDASTGISSSTVYTHKISGGGAVTINDVVFDVMTPGFVPPNFAWATTNVNGNASKDMVDNNNGSWNPGAGGVTGPGLLQLFDSFTYSGTGATAGTSKQTFTLSGLTPGQTYQLRLYIRMWEASTATSGRQIDLVFKNGSQPAVRPYRGLNEDRPGVMLGTGNADDAYYLSFDYVADSSTLVVDAEVPANNLFVTDSGSFHLYALTNEVKSTTPANFKITAVSRDASGNVVIDFTAAPNTLYKVTKSPNLVTAFGPLTVPLSSTTNGSGVGQVTVPAAEASEKSEFYRIEE